MSTLEWLLMGTQIRQDTGEDVAFSIIETPRYVGSGVTTLGNIYVGVNDNEKTELLYESGSLTEGSVLSVHNDNNVDYKNESGYNAIAILTISADDTGGATRHIKIHSGPTTDSTSGATLLFEFGQQDHNDFDASGDTLTTPPLTIQNNHYIIVENVDDTRTGTNNIKIKGQSGAFVWRSFVVERAS